MKTECEEYGQRRILWQYAAQKLCQHDEIIDMPDLLEIQKKSYQWFLDVGPAGGLPRHCRHHGLSGQPGAELHRLHHGREAQVLRGECKARDATYAAPIKVKVRLRNKETEEIKEQEIFMGDFPIMTKGATFVINGAERSIRLPDCPLSRHVLRPHRGQGGRRDLHHHGHPLPGRLAGV